MLHTPILHQLDTLSDTVRMVQITDTHLFCSTSGKLLGVNTQRELDLVLNKIRTCEKKVDLLLVTGDISQEYDVAIYQRFFQQLDTLGLPYFCLSGNHDDDRYAQHFTNHQNFSANQVIQMGAWCILMLNSSIAKEPGGMLSQTSLQWLRRMVEQYADKHLLIALHHHPVPMHSAWIDEHILKNADEFWHIIKDKANVKAVLCGHVHQQYDAVHHGIRVMATPSTSVQFKPLSNAFEIDNKPSGYRWMTFFHKGALETGVKRLDNVSPTIDVDAQGY